jgi:hypothetical protein
MTTITVLSGQSIFDIALMTCGVAEAAYDIALANNVDITDNIEGKVLVIPDALEKNKKMVDYYTVNKIAPATDFEDLPEEILIANPGEIDAPFH